MKTTKKFTAIIILGTALFFQSCTENGLINPGEDNGILPERFKIDIPNSLSNNSSATKSATESQADTLKGNAIYAHLNNFIAVGEAAADIVQGIIFTIAVYDIDEPMSLSFNGDDDNRVKNLVVTENDEYAEETWEFMLTITDAESESEPDGGKALQILWNRRPIEGIAILKPYNIDRTHNTESPDAVFRITYSEAGTDEYETYMIVEIAGLTMPDPGTEPFALNSMKMYVGKKGDRIDVFGNSDHPNARFFTENTGFNWAFVSSGSFTDDIAVAEVGLPPSGLDESSREVLLKDYSIKNVLTGEINDWFLDNFGFRPDSSDLAGYLRNADAPGYFNGEGFVQGGTSPGAGYDELVGRIQDLSPFNPKSINGLTIEFK
jgi:hypothetical protein